VHREDLPPAEAVRRVDPDLAIETTGAPQRRVKRLCLVGRRDRDHLATPLETVEKREQLRDHAPFDLLLAGGAVAFRRDRVDPVDEHDRRGVLARPREHTAQSLFRRTVAAVDDLRAVDGEEGRPAFGGDGAGDHGLAGTGRADQENALRRIYAETFEGFRMAHRKLDHLADSRHHPRETAEVVVADRCRIGPAGRTTAGLDLRLRVDDDRPWRGLRRGHTGGGLAPGGERDPQRVALRHGRSGERPAQKLRAETGRSGAEAKQNTFRRRRRDRGNPHHLAERHAGIGADGAIEQHEALAPLRRRQRQSPGMGEPATDHREDTAGRSPDRREVGRVDAEDSAIGIRRGRSAHAQADRWRDAAIGVHGSPLPESLAARYAASRAASSAS
jgi:hypothetical protein